MKSRFRLALAGLAAAAALAAPEEAASAAEAPHGSWHVVYTQAGAASSSFEQAVAVSGRHAWVLGASGSTSFAWPGTTKPGPG